MKKEAEEPAGIRRIRLIGQIGPISSNLAALPDSRGQLPDAQLTELDR